MRIAHLLLLLLVASAIGHAADEILLRNGNVIRGVIISEKEDAVVIRVGENVDPNDANTYIEMTLDKKRIRTLARGTSPFSAPERTSVAPPDPEPTPKPATVAPISKKNKGEGDSSRDRPHGDEEATPEAPSDTSDKKEKEEEVIAAVAQLAAEIDETLRADIDGYIEQLASEEEEVRNEAESRLTAIGELAAPLVAQTILVPKGRFQHISAIQVLKKMRERRAVMMLIDQLNGGRRDRTRMWNAHQALKSITGQDLYFDDDDSLRRRRYFIGEWQKWFESVEEEYPPQFYYEDRAQARAEGKGAKLDSPAWGKAKTN